MRFFVYKTFLFFLLLKPCYLQARDIGTLTIALVGPMSGPKALLGKRMAQTISFQINKFSKEHGQSIKLLTYDDQSTLDGALKVAEQIKKQGNIAAIIGNISFSSAQIVSDAFKKLEIPFISPTILKEEDLKNPWLFRTLYDTHSLGVFLANYMRKISGYKTVNIIYSDNNYGQALSEDFYLPFLGFEGVVKNKWKINNETLEEDIANISTKLLAEQNHPADALFLAIDPKAAADFISAIKRKGLIYKIFGTDYITDSEFIKHLSISPEEEFNQGYFSNGIMGAVPIILDIGNEQAQIFNKQYTDLYQETPNWLEASFYDSSLLATKAITEALKKEISSIKDLRYQIKEYLFSLNEFPEAFNGITGPIYFDKDQKRVPQIMVGEFFNQKLISAYAQLYPINDESIIDLKSTDKKNIFTVNSQYLQKIDIVFTDIDIIEISDLDLKTSDYVMNFYLSFRYRGDIDAHNIEFINQAEPIKLGKPFEKVVENGITQESYRIEARFNTTFDFAFYPFDTQQILLQFRNKNGFESNIIYVRDEVSMSFESVPEDLKQIQKSKTLEDWTATNILYFQDYVEHSSTFGDPRFFNLDKTIQYSRFNVKLFIKRNSISFALKNFLPIIIIFLLIYLVTFTDFSTAISVYVGAILATIVEHVRISGELPGIGYTIALDYLFYAVYFIIVAQITLSIIAENKRLNNKEKTSERIILINKVIFPILVSGIIIIYVYSSFAVKNPLTAAPEAAKKAQIASKHSDKPILSLSSWHSDNEAAMWKILAVFNARQSDFKVQFEPIRYSQYYETLLTQLNTSKEPDMFFIPGNEIDAQLYIKNGYASPLKDFVPSHKLGAQEKMNWTDDGVLYGAPLQAISQGIFYNKDIFRKLNIAIPKTWEAFVEAMKKIKASGITPLANGTKDSWANAEILFMSIAPNFIGGAKGRNLFEDGKRCFNDVSVVNAFKAVKELTQFIPENHAKLISYESREIFMEQKAAMWIAGSWELTFFAEEKMPFSLGVFAVPAPLNHQTIVIFHYDSAVAINTKSLEKEKALKFLNWTQTLEYAKLLQDNMPGYFSLMPGAPPPKNALAREFLYLSKENQSDSRWILPAGTPSSYQLMAKATTEVINGVYSPEKAAEYLQEGLATWFRPAQICR